MNRIGYLAVIVVALVLGSAAPASGAYVATTQWGSEPPLGSEFDQPGEAATDAAGNVYVADAATRQVKKFDAGGNFILAWGTLGSGDGQFNAPSGVAVDAAGDVYVGDRYLQWIQKFDSSGNFITRWGTPGAGDGQFYGTKGVAVGPGGAVYVVDYNNKRVQKFSSTGAFVTKWGSFGSGDGQFLDPWGIATDSAGNVYVTDPYSGAVASVQKFDSNGGFIARWNVYATDIGISPADTIYLTGGSAPSSVRRYDTGGNPLGQWGSSGSGDGQFNGARGVAVGAGGAVHVVDSGNWRVQKFDSTGTFLGKWGSHYRSRDGQLRSPRHVALDAAGNVYVADAGNARVQKFSPSGAFLARWGTPGTGTGQFYGLAGIALDAAGNVYTTEDGYAGPQRIQKFDPGGSFITSWGIPGTGDGQFNTPSDVAVSPVNGDVYVMDTFNHRVQRFNPDGSFVAKWGGFGSANGQFQTPKAIAVAATGDVYVGDYSNARVQKFDANGTYLTQWPVSHPISIAIDGSGNVLVTQEYSPSQVRVFGADGTPKGQFGSDGSAPGQLSAPSGVAVNADGDAYVSDTGNHRIQIFRDNAGYPRPKGATPMYVPLVPAFSACNAANRQHAAPLAFGSCDPPSQVSAFVTTGTPDSNGQAANMVGAVRLTAIAGSPATPADEADVTVDASITDVHNAGGLSDYTGELRLQAPLRITDRFNGVAQDRVGTLQDTTLGATIGCAATSDPAIGSTCSLTTTLDTLVPGTVAEGKRSNWALGQVSVTDGGPDGDGDTPVGNTVFAVQGLFAP